MLPASGQGNEVILSDRSPLVINRSSSLLDALRAIDASAQAMVCLVDEESRLVGVLTDGDARRAIIAGHPLSSAAVDHASTEPRTVGAGTPRAHVLDLMRALRLLAIPEVDEDRRVLGVHSLSDVVGPPVLPNAAAVMAGGRGARLGALTKNTPKPLMTVAGRSILEWIILGLVGNGIRQIYVSVNYLADQIVEHLGDGSRLGCSVTYLREDPEVPLGTGGSLALIPDVLTEPLIVMNGDLMVDFDARSLLEAHRCSGARVTMGTREYTHSVPFGVVELDESGAISRIVEKPDLAVQINSALYCIDPDLIGLVPRNAMSHMPDLVQQCLDRGLLVKAWEISSEWIDVGTPTDLVRAKGLG